MPHDNNNRKRHAHAAYARSASGPDVHLARFDHRLGLLLGALTAATKAASVAAVLGSGPIMLAVLALIHAELGGAYPASGGTARFPCSRSARLPALGRLGDLASGSRHRAHRVEASISYLNNIGWVKTNLNMLRENGTLTGRRHRLGPRC